jgi:hypothetical protein
VSNQSANDLIMGGGAPSVKWPAPGTKVIGEIVDTATTQQTDFKTGELKFWKDGNPKMQAVITLQTDERDPEVPDDDGKRRLFVSSWRMRDAIRDAIKTAGARHLEHGGKLAVQFTAIGDDEAGTGNPPKFYAAQYKPPAPGAVPAADLLDDNSPF